MTCSALIEMGKRVITTLLIAVLSLFTFNSNVHADSATDGTGNQLVQFCNHTNSDADNLNWFGCVMFVYGVAEGAHDGVIRDSILTFGKTYPGNAVMDKRINTVLQFCIPTNATRQQMALVVSKYLDEHPEVLNKSDYAIVINAFEEAWPCSQVSQ